MKSRKLWLFRMYAYISCIVIFLMLLIFIIGWFYTVKTEDFIQIFMAAFIIFQVIICILLNNPISKKYRELMKHTLFQRVKFNAINNDTSPNKIVFDAIDKIGVDIKTIILQVSFVLTLELFAFIVMIQGWHYVWISSAYQPFILLEFAMAICNVVLFASIMALASFIKELKEDALKEIKRVRSTNAIYGSMSKNERS